MIATFNIHLLINPLYPNINRHILCTILYTFSWTVDKENLFKNQELYKLLIISLILVTLMFDSGVILWGEIRGWPLLGVKG